MSPDVIARVTTGGSGSIRIVQRTLAKMGSSLHIESEVGIGTSMWFEIDLPISTADPNSPVRRVDGKDDADRDARSSVAIAMSSANSVADTASQSRSHSPRSAVAPPSLWRSNSMISMV